MVNVQRQASVAPARDETALDIFRHQWELYRKFLTHDYLENAGAYAELHRYLNDNVRPSPRRSRLRRCERHAGAKGRRAPPALELAKRNLASLPCAVELDEADFVQAMRTGSGPADVVWISLSLHHLTTPDKRTLMSEIQAQLSPNGALLIYEPTCRDGESRADYLDRFEEIGRREWTALSAEEFEEAMRHVRTCDLPETVTEWGRLGRAAGFTRVAELYKAPSDLFRLFSYRA